MALPEQIEVSLDIRVEVDGEGIRNVVIAGMGGSAIGGDIVKACCADVAIVPIEPVRGFTLPAYVDEGTLLIAVSYSGNTLETLAMLEQGIRAGARCVGITHGGRMADLLHSRGLPCLIVPDAPAPRAATGYLTVPTFNVLESAGIASFRSELERAADGLRKVVPRYAPDADDGNLPLEVATLLAARVPYVYAPRPYLPAARRFMTQLNEVSKVLGHWGEVPEIAHNEIVGWDIGTRGDEHVILMEGDMSHGTDVFNAFFKEVLARRRVGYTVIGDEPLSGRMGIFHHIMVGDIASNYLAFMRNLDPFTIAAIDELKARYPEG